MKKTITPVTWKCGKVLSEPDVIEGHTTFWSEVDGIKYWCKSKEGNDELDLVFLNPDDVILFQGKITDTDLLQITDIRLII